MTDDKPMQLFDSWLFNTELLQRTSYGNDLPHMDPETRAAEFRTQAFSAVSELVEMSNEIGWKPWASSRHLNREAFIAEGVDVLHFVANLLLLAGCTDDELNTAYLAKMEKNRRRQLEGYDGVTTKCPACKRALDDTAVVCQPEAGFCGELGEFDPGTPVTA